MADQFPVDVFQTGSGTSTNMNMNEVIANRAAEILGDAVHPNDHVNASQSSNDTFPSAARVAAVLQLRATLLPALESLRASLLDLSSRHQETVKMARTHLMDAVPMTFGQEVSGWARAIELSSERVDAMLSRLAELPIGGTAVGTGLNAPRGFGSMVAQRLTARTGCTFTEATNHFEAQSSQDAMVEAGATLKVVALSLHKIAGDLRLLGSGPNGGLGEITLPALQAGSSIMPGKVNPVIPEMVQQVAAQVVGNDATMTFAATMSTLQLSTAMPITARSLLSSIHLLANAASLLDTAMHPRHRGRRRTDAAQRRTVPRHRHGSGASYRIRRSNQARAPGRGTGRLIGRTDRAARCRRVADRRRVAGHDPPRPTRSAAGSVADEIDTDQCQVVEALSDRRRERFDEVLRGQVCMRGGEITQTGQPNVEMLASPLDQSVGEHQDAIAGSHLDRQRFVVLALEEGQRCSRSSFEIRRRTVRHDQRREVTGLCPPQSSRGDVEHGIAAGHEGTVGLVQPCCHVVGTDQDVAGFGVLGSDRPEDIANLHHENSGAVSVAGHIGDHQRHLVVVESEDVIPVAADGLARIGRLVHRGDADATALREAASAVPRPAAGRSRCARRPLPARRRVMPLRQARPR